MLNCPALTQREIHAAASHALLRAITCRMKGTDPATHTVERKPWDSEIQGACAELAFCKHYGIYWTGLTHAGARDCGNVDVRWASEPTHGLFVNPQDDDKKVIVLMDGFAPTFRQVGWLYAGEGRKSEWQYKRATCGEYEGQWVYLVPRRELYAMPIDEGVIYADDANL